MNSLKSIKLQNIGITAHAMERAKQRLDFGVDKSTLVFEANLRELIQKAHYAYESEGKHIYSTVYKGKVIEIVVHFIAIDRISVLTIIVK